MKNTSIRLLLCLLALGAIAGCRTRSHVSADVFTLEIYRPRHATGFEIVGAEGMRSTMLRIDTPWQGDVQSELNFFVARDGETPPDGFTGQVIEAGARRIVCMSSTYVAMLDALGAVDRIVGVSGADLISNEYVNAHRDRIGDVGYDANTDFELLVSLRPDVVLLYGIRGENSALTGKLAELGIPYVYIGEYLEESPLGKAEWLVAVAEIIDERSRGEAAFEPIPKRYETLKHLVQEAPERPSVMINTPYGDNWFMASTQSYVARLIGDAGADYVFRQNNGPTSVPIDLEEAYLLASQSDFWINTGRIGSLAELKTAVPRFAEVPAVRNRRVWNSDRRSNAAGGNDYWESGVVRPDVVLGDLIAIFHPELSPRNETCYYRRLE